MLITSPEDGGSSFISIHEGSVRSGFKAGMFQSRAFLTIHGRNPEATFHVKPEGRGIRAELTGPDGSLLWSTHPERD
jgi:hypothetical protein